MGDKNDFALHTLLLLAQSRSSSNRSMGDFCNIDYVSMFVANFSHLQKWCHITCKPNQTKPRQENVNSCLSATTTALHCVESVKSEVSRVSWSVVNTQFLPPPAVVSVTGIFHFIIVGCVSRSSVAALKFQFHVDVTSGPRVLMDVIWVSFHHFNHSDSNHEHQ